MPRLLVPLYAFVRRRGHSTHEAEDLIQGFLADLLERGDLAALDRSKGRFRSFLRAACEHYLCNRLDHDRAAKSPACLPPWPGADGFLKRTAEDFFSQEYRPDAASNDTFEEGRELG